jgi:hypothetical protein
LPGTNTLPYYKESVNYDRKKFCGTGHRLEQKGETASSFLSIQSGALGGYGEAKKKAETETIFNVLLKNMAS